MKKKIAFLLILAMSLTLASCGGTGKNEAVTVNVDKIDFGSFSAEDQKLVELNGDQASVQSGNDEVDKAINDKLAQETQDFLADADEVLTEAKTFHSEAAADDEWASSVVFADDLSVRNAYVSGDVLSIIYEHYTYLGGAHGGSTRYAYNFNLTDGHLLSWDEISADGSFLTDTMHSYIVNAINSDQYSDYYFFDNYEDDLNNSMSDYNWYIANGNLYVIYNQYAIAPYAAGIIEFAMPLNKIDNLKLDCASASETDGALTVAFYEESDQASVAATFGTGNAEGEIDVILTADKAVNNVKVYKVSTAYDGSQYVSDLLGFISRLDNKKAIRLNESLGEVVPTMLVEYQVNGEKEYYNIIESGKDGSLNLVKADDTLIDIDSLR